MLWKKSDQNFDGLSRALVPFKVYKKYLLSTIYGLEINSSPSMNAITFQGSNTSRVWMSPGRFLTHSSLIAVWVNLLLSQRTGYQ